MSSAYNPNQKHAQQDDPESSSNKCSAHGCPELGSLFSEGGPWLCRYHNKTPKFLWSKVTEVVNKNIRRLKILKAAEGIRIEEFDAIQKSKDWALDELIVPVPGETHPHWLMRIKETVFFAIKKQIDIAVMDIEVSSSSSRASLSWAAGQLTSGILMKKPPFKSKKQQLEELEELQHRGAA